MTDMKKVLFALFFILMIINGVSYAVDYPNPVGFVNDFANVFSADQKNALTEKIRNFEKETSAEIAVVTVDSLEGQGIKTYSNNLFKKWGIGKKGKNNGVLLLLAVKDRKVRIETGYGNEGVLNDAKAGRVIRETMSPLLKQDKFAEGLIVGTDEVMTIIKSETNINVNKAQASKGAASQAAAAAIVAPVSNAEDNATFFAALAFIALIGVLVGIGVIVGSIKRNREKLHSLRSGISTKINAFSDLESSYANISREIDALNACSPKPILKYPLNERGDIERFLTNVKNSLTSFSDIVHKKAFSSDTLFDSSEKLRNDVLAAKGKIHAIASELHSYRRDKEAAQKFIDYLPGAIKKAEEEVNHSDVSDHYKRRLAQIKSSLGDTSEIIKKDFVDWTQVYGTLKSANDEIDSLAHDAINEKRKIAEARSKSMEMVNSLPGIIQKAEREINHDDVAPERAKDLAAAKKLYERGKVAYDSSSWVPAFMALAGVSDALHMIRSNAESDKARASEARTEGPKLLAAFPGLAQDTEAKLKDFNPRFTGESITMLDNAKKKYAEAKAIESKNWLGAFALLTAAGVLLANALTEARNQKEAEEKQLAKKRRQEEERKRREREEEEEEERRRRRRNSDTASGLAGFSIGSSLGGGSSSGDSGSFGGGDSGGGGADSSF